MSKEEVLKSERLNLRIERELKDRLKAQALKERKTYNALVREILWREVERTESQRNAMAF